ncbi:AI-2E family transporter [Aliarcobacter trophiarum LMG 25534]|uniref:AI-2E family transporter n=1 Tax=Aliarcobacter trophiarum LMG 25534 TaxID=1032241 RepID=A0AAD0VLV3_9BACT|nr:AI-2E family transporter [Aliarcobacter trophiarum]AXK48708.1 acid membrane antigen A [Aliarcobacter trophiarum LMG 25534]RXI28297.1 AI-2E family transporter [Aliarcobacter trophiarum]RXJ91348.1 AI-2E family transporter [Aliarcobacter trophiarum LMG 25534]
MKPIYFLILLALLLFYFIIELFNPFLKSIFVATLLTIATNSLYLRLNQKIKNRVISSSIFTISMTALFFLPILYCILSFATFFNQVDQALLIQNLNEIKNSSLSFLAEISFMQDFLQNITKQIDIGKIVQELVSFSAYLGKNSAKFMLDMILILIFFFFFTLFSNQIAQYLKDLTPINSDDANILFNESSSVMSVVFYSILTTAIFQGFLFGAFLSAFGYNGLLFGVLYGFASLVPVIGGVIMWLPVAIYEAATGTFFNAIFIAIYSIVVISIIADTFIKPLIISYINKRIVKTPTKINSLLIFFAIVAGLGTFGFWGMIIGPAMVSLFVSIMHLIKKYSNF